MSYLLLESGDTLLLESGAALTIGTTVAGYVKLSLNKKAPIDIGDRAVISARFYDTDDVLTDPDDVTFRWRDSAGTETSYEWATSSLVEQSATGVFVFLAPTAEVVGPHYCRVVSTAGLVAADQIGVGVRLSKFTTN